MSPVARVPVTLWSVAIIGKRADGRCEIDGLPLTGRHLHHRRPRGMGSSTADPHAVDNLLLLHPNCHLVRVERNRAEAYRNGWLVHRWDDPAEVPVLTYRGWVWLWPDGSVTPVSESEAERLRSHGVDGRGG